ncbi:metal ABC transporter ATP-binding protein [Jeotgalibaca sp. MA1X17-3]|uniref:metal ABC transporter ATP-binding protein n=1 Tax=Jeotgalibaca sp. MA1X17-3 TaxID=2908211 RepID=UPI001F361756|nr:metal ABC transporter ATP-binding protein [Jeotgalibaca sp. MA1X17-3]UJF16568.1 metal ABC transporter ATP-binding protein [Jeotgalibaca sp. MA1X17-3]
MDGIIAKDMSVYYRDKKALDNISVEIRKSKITGIVGPNGAGKSTFLKALIRLIPSENKGVSIFGKTLKEMQRKVAYVEQRSALDLTFPIDVKGTVLLGTYPKLSFWSRPGKNEKDDVEAALKKVELWDLKDRQIDELSGGQLQRVFIARALAQEADLILLDEPFVGIDMTSEKMIIEILKELRNEGKTIIIVHHDLHKVVEYFDDLIVLDGKMVGYGTVESTFTKENLDEAYGEMFGSLVLEGVQS